MLFFFIYNKQIFVRPISLPVSINPSYYASGHTSNLRVIYNNRIVKFFTKMFY